MTTVDGSNGERGLFLVVEMRIENLAHFRHRFKRKRRLSCRFPGRICRPRTH
jgi:hypothetical protein